jgi:hypothetical protein
MESPNTTRAFDVIVDRVAGAGLGSSADVAVAAGAGGDPVVSCVDWGDAEDVNGPDGAGAQQALAAVMAAPASSATISR